MKLKKSIFIIVILLLSSTKLTIGQIILSDLYRKNSYNFEGVSFTLYSLSRANNDDEKRIKAKYFAKNAYKRFISWKSNKKILLACSGAFSVNWGIDSPPYGLCIDNGYVVNRNLAIYQDQNGNSLDGLVIVYGGGEDAGGIAIKDIEYGKICTQNPTKCYDIKNNSTEKVQFINWAKENSATVFQLPIMYSNEYGKNYGERNYGDKKERRYLALCKDYNGNIYHLIINVMENVYMNACAESLRRYLTNNYQIVYGILVLDTGGKNILNEYYGPRVSKIGSTEIEKATNLLVYYYE